MFPVVCPIGTQSSRRKFRPSETLEPFRDQKVTWSGLYVQIDNGTNTRAVPLQKPVRFQPPVPPTPPTPTPSTHTHIMSRVTRSSSVSQHASSLYSLVPVSSSSRLDDTPLTKKSSNATSASLEARRKHQCSSCPRAFTTSGHLSRHMRIHTGERNHHCPFPGCDVKCSRQDNLQQQYVYVWDVPARFNV